MVLGHSLKPEKAFTYQAYDPGIEDYEELPKPAEMVCAINVLECVEPECIDEVLDHLEDLTEFVLFCVIDTGPGNLIERPMEWWLPKIWVRFSLQTVQTIDESRFMVIANNAHLLFE